MTKLTSAQRDALTEQFTEIVVDNMSMESLVCYAQEQLTAYHDHMMESELKEVIDIYDEDLWDELVDNVTTVTYGLAEGETLSFPVHSPTK